MSEPEEHIDGDCVSLPARLCVITECAGKKPNNRCLIMCDVRATSASQCSGDWGNKSRESRSQQNSPVQMLIYCDTECRLCSRVSRPGEVRSLWEPQSSPLPQLL